MTIVMPRPDLRRPGRAAQPPAAQGVVARTGASLATAVVAPAVLFCGDAGLQRRHGADRRARLDGRRAVLATTTRRPVSGLLVLALGIMAVKTGFTLATGNTFVYFVQPVVVDAVVATSSSRRCGPLDRSWPGSPRTSTRSTPRSPRGRGCGGSSDSSRCCGAWSSRSRATITLWLLLSLSTVDFVLVKSSAIIALTLLAAAATVVLSAVVGRREGLLVG